ncbi:hypothetical protein [Photobacterium rosenbergii]|uniref:Avidin n=1 Tax=Photobacterium rosenbergii TaxID=294936 RepID=A0ABU3ZE02_9GAMM|nr:hypothetical protein [Photobacterium rosenbergii]MDV5168332.1 hypothetical protein [Photobacterium rosenbergii]
MKFKIMKYILLLSLFLSLPVNAQIVSTKIGQIDKMFAYDDYGAVAGRNGSDIVVWTVTGLAACEHGVWLTPAAPGYSTITSFLLTAYTTKQKVRFQVYNDIIWKGSTKFNFCQIDSISFE